MSSSNIRLHPGTLLSYNRLQTKEVSIGNLLLGNGHPIRVQTMTTTDTMDTMGTVEQTIRCIEAGAELVRITAPSKKEAENLAVIRAELERRGYHVPLIADIHFTPNAAEIAARIIQKVRVNPGNYVDKKKFELIDYTDADYAEEIDRIRERFTPLVKICREYGTAMRIGTNHGSLSDRIMSRYGDTPMGMVESAMEFLRIARGESFHNIVLSMKSSNPQVMVQAYRLLVSVMQDEFGEIYPLHLGVTEAGDGEEGRIKSAIGIGTLLEEGIGDTIRVSLTEDPELEIPVCKDIVKRYATRPSMQGIAKTLEGLKLTRPPHHSDGYQRRESIAVQNIGGNHVPSVIADLSKLERLTPADLQAVGYTYDELTDKWHIGDTAADYIFTGSRLLDFALPGTLKVIVDAAAWLGADDDATYFPIYGDTEFAHAVKKSPVLNFVMVDCYSAGEPDYALLEVLGKDKTVVLCLSSQHPLPLAAVRRMFEVLAVKGVRNPTVLIVDSNWTTPDEHLIHFATESGALLLDGFGDGVCFGLTPEGHKQLSGTAQQTAVTGRNYVRNGTPEAFI
ncbi:MAG TPA: (E)-4-hydroxy-3-methylbut-2-enyl-diphosphate synthase, partial [Flavisolibacter sp.]